MASEVSICNLALTSIGKKNISDLDEGTTESKACKQHYAQARDELLQEYPWRFAQATVALAEITNDKSNKWEYACQLPADCLQELLVHDQYLADYIANGGEIVGGDGGLIVAGGYAYEIEGSVLYCNVSPAYLTYTKRVTDPTRFRPLFVAALGDQVATKIAFPLTKDLSVRKDAYQLLAISKAKAMTADANSVRESSDRPSEFIEARG